MGYESRNMERHYEGEGPLRGGTTGRFLKRRAPAGSVDQRGRQVGGRRRWVKEIKGTRNHEAKAPAKGVLCSGKESSGKGKLGIRRTGESAVTRRKGGYLNWGEEGDTFLRGGDTKKKKNNNKKNRAKESGLHLTHR